VVERGFVTYSNAAKSELLGVPAPLIAKHGAVSAQVARAMAEGALSRAPVDVAIAVTGIAGPGGASPPSRSAWSISRPHARRGRRWSSAISFPAIAPPFASRRSKLPSS